MKNVRRMYWPALNLVGPGAIKEVGLEIKNLGLKKALIVSDKVLNSLGIVKKLTDVLEENDVKFAIYDDVQQNPTMKNCHDGLQKFNDEKCDLIISLGGGSPQDCAKAVGILKTNGGKIRDYEGIGISKKKSVPIVAINTTAGTASEVTVNYVITDEERYIKMVMVDPNCLATISVNDSELMIDKPAALTAATGMDALTHAMEAYITAGAFRLSDTLALESIKLIGESLENAVKDGTDIEARSKMAWASYVAGLSFSNAGLGIVHSMAHQLGSEYNLPHGVANAVLLPHVEEYNMDACGEKFRDIAEALGVSTGSMSTTEANNAAITAIKSLSKRIGIPSGLEELGVKEEDFGKLADQALADACTGGNPKQVTKEDIINIYKKAM
ncbi:iron-containing alcohol dehydrogenase [uncultured Ilyobacter sp.]|uniref:iron-containing alcohol dehydrogenase n=1 Tax=uncultured Ilyobacter sp. TaxID=544433 RepID=UPI0029C01810|nr:iron-containing alcohol dehydrogenase [uncultured Ilyobacter sp.]